MKLQKGKGSLPLVLFDRKGEKTCKKNGKTRKKINASIDKTYNSMI